MAHAQQERYSSLVDAKLRNTLVTRDNYIFNNKYEGDTKAGVVKIPVRDTEVTVKDYDKAKGLAVATGTTAYLTLALDKDKGVNELIDGFDAVSVPDGIVADRIDSAGYSLALQMDKDSIEMLEGAEGINVATDTTPCTVDNAYSELMKARVKMSKAGVPNEGRWAIVAPEFLALLMQDSNFIKQSDLSQELVMAGVVGKSAGFNLFESNNVAETTEFICGHPNYCHRVQEWQVPVHLQDLNGSGTFIGASAVQGRKIYGVLVSKGKALYIKKNA